MSELGRCPVADALGQLQVEGSLTRQGKLGAKLLTKCKGPRPQHDAQETRRTTALTVQREFLRRQWLPSACTV